MSSRDAVSNVVDQPRHLEWPRTKDAQHGHAASANSSLTAIAMRSCHVLQDGPSKSPRFQQQQLAAQSEPTLAARDMLVAALHMGHCAWHMPARSHCRAPSRYLHTSKMLQQISICCFCLLPDLLIAGACATSFSTAVAVSTS